MSPKCSRRAVLAALLAVGGIGSGCQDDSVPDCPGGLPAPEVVVSGMEGLGGMLAHGTDFYWTRYARAANTYELMAMTSAGTSIVATSTRGIALLQFTDTLFWLDYTEGGLHQHRIRRLGAAGAETVVEGPQELTGYAVSRDYAYFHDTEPNKQTFPSRISRQLLAGGSPEILDTQLPYTSSYAADDQSLFVRTMDFPGDLLRISPATREITTLRSGVYTTIHPLRIDDDWLYWPEETQGVWKGSGSLVRRMPKAGGAAATLAESDVISGLELDATHVYYWSRKAINRVAKTGGQATCVTPVSPVPAPVVTGGAFAVGDTHVYWSDGESIWRVPKPAP